MKRLAAIAVTGLLALPGVAAAEERPIKVCAKVRPGQPSAEVKVKWGKSCHDKKKACQKRQERRRRCR